MKRIAAAIAGLSLLGLGARAAEEKAEAKTEVKRDEHGARVKTTKKHKSGKVTKTSKAEHKVSKDMGGGSTEVKEEKSDTDAPGTAHDTKVEKKETVKRNAQGDVIEHEKKDEAK